MKKIIFIFQKMKDILKEREMLLSISAKDFFEIYSQRDSYDELPLINK